MMKTFISYIGCVGGCDEMLLGALTARDTTGSQLFVFLCSYDQHFLKNLFLNSV